MVVLQVVVVRSSNCNCSSSSNSIISTRIHQSNLDTSRLLLVNTTYNK